MTILDRYGAPLLTVEPSKAVTGPGMLAMLNDPPLWSMSGNAQARMRQAQGLYRSNKWIHAAERVIAGKFASVDWHLEDEADEEITIESAPELAAVLRLFERPNPSMTRRHLWQITCRHMGLCGNGFWYLDQLDALAATPLAIYYLNPALMFPVIDQTSGALLGWQFLPDPRNPSAVIPLELSEVLHFTLDPPDDGVWGIGLVESAGLTAALSDTADRYILQTLGSGGRLAGMVAPKPNVTISDDGWQAMLKDWRNIQDDPNSAKRLQISKAPVDFTRTSATPNELALVDVAHSARDDILGLWGVPLSQIGGATPAGLNSGDVRKYDEAALWQNALIPRLEPFREVVQFQLLDRWLKLNSSIELELDLPEFDDDSPRYDLLLKSLSTPMRNKERRALIGLDPFGDPNLDDAVWLPITQAEVFTAPPDAQEQSAAISGAGRGGTQTEGGTSEAGPADEDAQPSPLGKAPRKSFIGLRAALLGKMLPSMRRDVASVLSSQKAEVAKRVRAKYTAIKTKPADTNVWWNAKRWDDELHKALKGHAAALAGLVSDRVSELLKSPAKADGFGDRVTTAVLNKGAARVTAINQRTRDAIQAALQAGLADGLGAAELGDLIGEITLDNGQPLFDEYRAELIARTESAAAYNSAALGSYGEFGVEMVEAVDGDGDDECAARDGKPFSLDEADGIEDHPNGTLDWIPITSEEQITADEENKAAPVAKAKGFDLNDLTELAKAMRPVINLPGDIQLPTPIVNVPAPIVNVPAANINVEAPIVNLPAPVVNVPAPVVNMPAAAKATGPMQVEVVKMVKREHVVRRKGGQVEGSVESDL